MKKTEKSKKNPKLEKYIWSIIKNYTPIMFLERYKITLKYGVEKNDRGQTIMEMELNYPYLDVDIYYSDKLIDMWNKKESIEQIIVHELCHIITEPYAQKAQKRYATYLELNEEKELLTDYIANIVMGFKK